MYRCSISMDCSSWGMPKSKGTLRNVLRLNKYTKNLNAHFVRAPASLLHNFVPYPAVSHNLLGPTIDSYNFPLSSTIIRWNSICKVSINLIMFYYILQSNLSYISLFEVMTQFSPMGGGIWITTCMVSFKYLCLLLAFFPWNIGNYPKHETLIRSSSGFRAVCSLSSWSLVRN